MAAADDRACPRRTARLSARRRRALQVSVDDVPSDLREDRQVVPVEGRDVERAHHVRAAAGGTTQGLVPAPAPDPGVVPGQQDVGHLEVVPHGRLRVDGVLQEPAAPCDSSTSDSGLPTTPGSSRPTASIITSAATSPPLST